MKKVIIVLFIFIVYFGFYNLYKNIEFNKSNEIFINNLLRNSNYYFQKEGDNKFIINTIKKILNIKYKEPVKIIERKFYKTNDIVEFGYIENSVIESPQVYIYQTHYNEKYIDGVNVKESCYLLQDELKKIGIDSVVSESDVEDYLNKNNLEFDDAYLATREVVKEALKKYPNLKLIIDMHRDGTSKENSTITINDKSYAKIMLVMNENYINIKNAELLTSIIKNKLNITRSVFHKKIYHFNQDLSENVILIEMGADKNTFEEVKNSMPILASSIKEYINEKD